MCSNNSIDNENEYENTNDSITENKDLKENLMSFWNKISKFDKENIFSEAITEEIAPGYFSVIEQPMDLSKIKMKIINSEY